MTRAPLPYRFLERDHNRGLSGWLESAVPADADKWTMRYMAFFDLLYHGEYAAAVKCADMFETGDAAWIITRLVMATVRDGIKIAINGPDGSATQAVTTAFQDFWRKGMLDALVLDNETTLATKGRSAILLEASGTAKRIVPKVLPGEYVWPQRDNAGAITGYRLIWPVEKEGRYYQCELSVGPDGRTIRTSGICKLNSDSALEYETYDTVEVNGQKQSMNQFVTDLTFLPVVHFDNMPRPLPQSDLEIVRAIIERKAQNAHDISRIASVHGEPPIAIEGPDPSAKAIALAKKAQGTTTPVLKKDLSKFKLERGSILFTGETGRRAYRIDNSGVIDALKLYDEMLDAYMVRQSQLTQIGAGMMKGGDWPSFESLSMSMRPLLDLVSVKRMMRTPKYELLALLWLRYTAARGFVSVGNPSAYTAAVTWPAILPDDSKGDRQFLIDCREEISDETFLTEAKRLGLKIDSPQDELKRIKEQQPSFITTPPPGDNTNHQGDTE